MILLEVDNLRKHFGPEPVLDGVTFEVRPGERIGLAGPNGSGKTTLLRILAGKDEPDSGAARLHSSVHAGYLEQQPRWDPGRTLWDEAQSALAGLIALQEESLSVAQALAEEADAAERKRLAARYDHLQHEIQRLDAYNLEHKIERVLQGLRFRSETFQQPVESLSGGEQNRLMLAKLLLAEPNLMFLDEPSNHLDIEATEWLEDFLLESSATLVLVSHDRCFLDKVTTRTLELFRGTVESYTGNFSAYWQQKAERLLVEQRTYEKQQLEIAKAKEFIRRHHYGQKHAQAEDRRKKLERIELVPPPREIHAPPLAFPPAARSGDIVLAPSGSASRTRGGCSPPSTCRSSAASAGACWGPTAAARPRSCAACWASNQPTKAAAGWARASWSDTSISSSPPWTSSRPPWKPFAPRTNNSTTSSAAICWPASA